MGGSHAHGPHAHGRLDGAVGAAAHGGGLGGPGGADGLLVAGDTPVHRLPAQVKIVAVVALVLVVVATPGGAWWAFAAYAVLLVAVAALARVPARTLVSRMAVELPFVVFAAVLPLVATGERVHVLGVGLSRPGLLAAATMLVKATLGVVGAILLASTTAPRDLLLGLERLHLPGPFVAIISFMLRYLAVVGSDLHRMRIARESRGFTGGSAGHLAAVASGAGALFVRSYERGERVHHAMVSRGYAGTMPALLAERVTRPRDWALGLALPLLALAVRLVLA